jgi:hypothetical protein
LSHKASLKGAFVVSFSVSRSTPCLSRKYIVLTRILIVIFGLKWNSKQEALLECSANLSYFILPAAWLQDRNVGILLDLDYQDGDETSIAFENIEASCGPYHLVLAETTSTVNCYIHDVRW